MPRRPPCRTSEPNRDPESRSDDAHGVLLPEGQGAVRRRSRGGATGNKPIVIALFLLGVCFAPRLGFGQTASPARSELLRLIADGVDAFNRATGLLRSDPDAALVAYRDARDRFQAAVDAGVHNGKLYYNLGNTCMHIGELGKAIAWYRRAQRLIPGDEQLQANLQFARSQRRDHIEAAGQTTFLQTVFFWHYNLSLRTRLHAALAAYAAFWLVLIVRLVSPRLRLTYVVFILLATWLSLGVSVAVDWPAAARVREGVLIADEVIVRKGNGEGYEPQFQQPLHQGVEFTVLDRRGGWVHLQLPDGHQGWIRDRDAELF